MLLVTVNGPGEVCYNLRPFLEVLHTLTRGIRVWVFIPPCQFASGWEEKMVRDLPLVEKIVGPRHIFKFLFWERILFPTSGLVLFMGGDLFYAYRLKRKSGYPLWAYGLPPRGVRKVDLFLVRFEKDLKAYPRNKRFLVGDLLSSWCFTLPRVSQKFFDEGKPRFLFLPGSRPFLYPYILPFYTEVALDLRNYFPEASFWLAFPEFLPSENLPKLDARVATWFHPIWGSISSLIEESDFVVMVPGSVNLEVAYRGKKGIVVLPLGKGIEKLPLQGFWGLLDVFPFWSKIVKPRLVQKLNQKVKWISLPNRILDVEVFPECRGRITAQEVGARIREELQKEELEKFSRIKEGISWNAARLLAEKVCEFLKK